MSDRPSTEAAGPEVFPQARAIFEAVVEHPPAARARVVQEACGDNAALRAAVQQMLSADTAPHVLLDGGPVLQANRWQPGETFAGHYRIVGLMGRGGMGEVYQAHDATLGRDVALKVLPSGVGGSDSLGDRLARFQREAQVLAALNHANIATIHGFEAADGVLALVLELVEGPTLADRIATGAMPLDEAVAIGRQIAVGLEAAHEQGVVHRDLKPANIKVRSDGTVKLLDFGLAKVVQSDSTAGGVVGGVASSPAAITSPSMIRAGVLLGTAAYMSPEQAKGRQADRRSDVWAFGAVLYEMLSGVRAFKGDDIAETLAAVLRADIDWSRLPSTTPPTLRQLLGRCLERDVTRRLRDIGEARIVLEDLAPGAQPARSTAMVALTHTPLWRRFGTPTLAALVAGASVGWALWPNPPSSAPPVTRFVLSTTAENALLVDPQSTDLTITPDGTRVVYKGGTQADRTYLFTHDLNQLDSQPLTRSGLPKGPFISPDGQWVGYFEPGQPGAALKRVAMGGGPALEVTRLDGPSRGATWVDNDTIIAASGAPATGLLRISLAGGAPTVLTRPNRERGEADHLLPRILPGSTSVLFTITPLSGNLDASEVAVLDLATGTWATVIRGASQAHYVSSGHLVYVAGAALWAVAFDVTRLQTIGTATVVVPHVVTLPTGVAEFDIAQDGTLVYVGSGGTGAAPRTLVWVDRQGRETPIAAPPRPYETVRLSPDGTRVATEIADPGNDIWVWHFARETLTRITSDPGLDQSPVWMPDGRRLVFTSQTGGVLGSLFWQAADGTGVAERLSAADALIRRATAVLADGSAVLFTEGTGTKMLSLDKDRRVQTLQSSPGAGVGGGGVVSPDGRWLAYVDITSGTPQIFVSAFSNPGQDRTQVSPDGGLEPRWARNGRELFYQKPDGVLMGVTVSSGATFSTSTPTRVLERVYYSGRAVLSRGATYDVAPDGQRFLMLKQAGSGEGRDEPATVIVVKNWTEELKRLAPVPR